MPVRTRLRNIKGGEIITELGREEFPETELSVLPVLLLPGRGVFWVMELGPEAPACDLLEPLAEPLAADPGRESCRAARDEADISFLTKFWKLSGLNASGPTDLRLFCICCSFEIADGLR